MIAILQSMTAEIGHINWTLFVYLCKEGFFGLSNPDVISSRVNQNRLYIVYPFKFGIV